MIPRNKIQREVAALFPTLPPLTPSQAEYAEKKCHINHAYFCCGETWCTHCGCITGVLNPLTNVTDGDEYECPFCGTKSKIKKSRKSKYKDIQYFTIITTHKGWQVLRHFLCYWEVRKSYQPEHTCIEVVQNWFKEDTPEVIVARPCTMHGGDSWDIFKDMEIRERHHSYYDYKGSKYDVWANFIYPHYSVLPKYKRNGFNMKLANNAMPPALLMKRLATDNEAEFLAKIDQANLLHYFKYKRETTCRHYLHAIKICHRNGYKVKDAEMWVDYIDLLEHFHLDTHNAHYVCPKNLKKAHDELYKRKERLDAKRRLEKQRKEAAEWEEKYRTTKGAYFGICFGNENIQIAVITSVASIAEEGLAMHHCVYANGYYKKENSLILSARDKDGNRIETIELDLKTLKVVQSRGVCNSMTPHHDEILKLVEENIGKFRIAA